MASHWRIAPPFSQEFANQFPEVNPLILQLLFNRGITTQAQIDAFLKPEYSHDVHDPFLFIDMAKAVERILQGIERHEKIVVYGDYDADGVSSTAIMVSTLRALGGDVGVYIPFRETEGYGLNLDAAEELVKQGTRLVVTVDCGISNFDEIALLQSHGVDVVVTDHHQEPLKLPNAYAIINQNTARDTYPFKMLAGCGVAYKVAQGLLQRHHQYQVTNLPDGWEKWLLDLVAIGTVADMMELRGENRTLVTYGLIVLRKTRRLGLQQLFAQLGTDRPAIDEFTIGFQIAPRLNAAGRLNHASSAYQLLITTDPVEAAKLVDELNATNQQRQKITENITQQAKKMIGEVTDQPLLSAVGDDWQIGVVGLVAGRLADSHYRPCLIMSRSSGGIIGSGRSIAEFDITAGLRQCDDLLARYGGHGRACGFTVKSEAVLPEFIERMTQLAKQSGAGPNLKRSLKVDAAVPLEAIDWPFFEDVRMFIPYGEGNPRPRFVSTGLTVVDCQTVGTDGKHLKLLVSHKTAMVRKTIGFSLGEWQAKLRKGDMVDLVFEVDVNEWNGNRELQLKIIDLALHDDGDAA